MILPTTKQDPNPLEGQRAEDRRGRGAARIVGLLRERARGVEAVHHVGAHDPADDERAEVMPAVPGAGAEVVQDDLRAAVEMEDQQDHEEGGADQLREDAEVVDPRHDLDAEHVHDRREDHEDRAEEQGVLRSALGEVEARVGLGAEDLEAGRHLRQHDLPGDRDGGDRDDRPDDVDPAGHPGGEITGHSLGPLVHGSGERVLPRELGEVQRDEHLAGEDDQPGPPHRRTCEPEAEREQLNHAGQDRDVAEARGERGEIAQRAVELLLVAESGKLARIVPGGSCGHCFPPSCGAGADIAVW